MSGKGKKIKMEELKQMDGKEGRELWVLIDGKIYNVTGYDHPGGVELYEQDKDNYTDLYEQFMDANHSSTATKLMKKFYIGELED